MANEQQLGWIRKLRWIEAISERRCVSVRRPDPLEQQLIAEGLIKARRLKYGKYAGRFLILTLTRKGARRLAGQTAGIVSGG